MTDITKLRASLRVNEGDKKEPYKDSLDLWTVATGRCLETAPLTGAEWKHLLDNGSVKFVIDQAGDDWLLDQGINDANKQCSVRFEFWTRLNDPRQNALTEMAYQMGIDKLCKFVGTIRAIREERWNEVEALALDSLWAKQTPKRAKKVATQLATGVWQ